MVASNMGFLGSVTGTSEIHVCCFGFEVWMLSFVFVLCRGVKFIKFLHICLTDTVMGRDKTSAYVSTLHCDILSSWEQMPKCCLQHY